MPGIFRIAPTPSGYLHKGNVFNFMLTWIWAKSNGGQILLRIDDMDTERAKPEYVENIFRVLHTLEMDWDLGPKDPEDFEENWSQKSRLPIYEAALLKLCAQDHVFACNCSRSVLVKNAPYPGTCENKNIPLDSPNVSWRLKPGAEKIIQFEDENLGNVKLNLQHDTGCFVVRKRDTLPAYQLTSVVDDAHFGITHILRGADLLQSTAMQLCIAKKLGMHSFASSKFWHHDLIRNTAGDKLSKSSGNLKKPLSISPAIFTEFAHWMGWDMDATSLPLLLDIAKQKLSM